MNTLGTRVCVMAPALLLMAAMACIKRIPMEVPIDRSSTSRQILRFVAWPPVIHAGETVATTWNVRNASRILLEEALDPDGKASDRFLHTLGHFPPDGSLNVSTKTTATYVLSCGSETELRSVCASASVSVIVK